MMLTKLALTLIICVSINGKLHATQHEPDETNPHVNNWNGVFTLKDGSVIEHDPRYVELDSSESMPRTSARDIWQYKDISRMTNNPLWFWFSNLNGYPMECPAYLPVHCSYKSFVVHLTRTGLYTPSDLLDRSGFSEKAWCAQVANWERAFTLSPGTTITHTPTHLTLTKPSGETHKSTHIYFANTYFHILFSEEDFQDLCEIATNELKSA